MRCCIEQPCAAWHAYRPGPSVTAVSARRTARRVGVVHLNGRGSALSSSMGSHPALVTQANLICSLTYCTNISYRMCKSRFPAVARARRNVVKNHHSPTTPPCQIRQMRETACQNHRLTATPCQSVKCAKPPVKTIAPPGPLLLPHACKEFKCPAMPGATQCLLCNFL